MAEVLLFTVWGGLGFGVRGLGFRGVLEVRSNTVDIVTIINAIIIANSASSKITANCG